MAYKKLVLIILSLAHAATFGMHLVKSVSVLADPALHILFGQLQFFKQIREKQLLLVTQRAQSAKKHATSWKKIKSVTTSSTSEFLNETEPIQAQFGCKVDIQPNSAKLDDKLIVAQNTKDHKLGLFEQDISGTVAETPVRVLDAEEAHNTAFSKDGAYLASVHRADVKIWDAKTGDQLYAISGPAARVAFSPDNSFLACMDKNGLVEIRDCKTGKLVSQFSNGYASSILAFSRDNKYILCKSDIWKQRPAHLPYRLQVWENK